MNVDRAKLIRFLREELQDEHDQIPIGWAAKAADEALRTIYELAHEYDYKEPCDYCKRSISHNHRWSRLTNQIRRAIPRGVDR